MKEVAKNTKFEYSHPLSSYSYDCSRTEKVTKVQIVSDYILCNYFNLDTPSLTLGII